MPSKPRASLRLLPFLVALATFLAAAFTPRTASAYAWMMRHEYTSCTPCHTDPSGSGLLTEYGRAQGDGLLRMRWGTPPDEPPPSAGFAWGLVRPPEWLVLGGGVRAMGMRSQSGSAPAFVDLILMQADLHSEVRVGGFRANGSIGVVGVDGSAASVAGPVVSREHWLGWSFDDDQLLVRAGRIQVPFGLRSVDHTWLVRRATRTDINDTQQHGAAVAWSGGAFRGELMGIAGNYQLTPDAYRERGYSGYLEWAPTWRAAIGASSLVTHAARDLELLVANTRQAHGLFARAVPWTPLVVMAEADAVHDAPDGGPSRTGVATVLSLDYEPVQGLHAIATGETLTPGAGVATTRGAWLGLDWFFAPHADVRVDGMYRRAPTGATSLDTKALMINLHAYL